MEERLCQKLYEAPKSAVLTIDVGGILCNSVENGGIESGIPDEI